MLMFETSKHITKTDKCCCVFKDNCFICANRTIGNLNIKSKKREDLFRGKLRLSSDLLATKLTWRKPFWYFIFSFLDKKKKNGNN